MFAARGIAKQPWYMPAFTIDTLLAVSQLPAGVSEGRFVAEIYATSGGVTTGGVSIIDKGLSIWDFNTETQYYEIAGFAEYPDYWGYAVRTGTAGMASATTWFAFDGGSSSSSSDTKAFVARIDIGVKPSVDITFVSPFTYRFDEPTKAPAFFSPSVGDGNGNCYFGY